MELQSYIIAFGVLAILDFCWAYHTKSRYFSLHGIWNIIITVLCFSDLYKTLLHPLKSMLPNQEINEWPIILTLVLHVWHCIAYGKLTFDDYFHHLVFGLSLGCVNLLWDWGHSSNFFIFFICGFPGGLDYLMLAAVKHSYIHKISEKRINVLLNMWCRGPGCIASACLIWVNWMSGQTKHIPVAVKLATMFLAIFNGQYYSRRVVESGALHEEALRRSESEETLKSETEEDKN